MNTLFKSVSSLLTKTFASINNIAPLTPLISELETRRFVTLDALHRKNLKMQTCPKKKKPSALNGLPFSKGIVLKNVIKKPRKPNSASRKCVLVKLSIGKEMTAFVPGVGHNLQEHQVVLCRVGKLRDTPGVKIRCVRGKYDLPHVTKKVL